jgi:hypothetical protein
MSTTSIRQIFLAAVTVLALPALTASCASLEKLYAPATIDPTHPYSSDGFEIKFGMPGEWYLAKKEGGYFAVGQKPLEDGTSKLAVARYGPFVTPGGKHMTNAELIAVFKLQVEAQAKGERFSHVQSKFTERKFKKADCLQFWQTAQDQTDKGPMALANDGLICLHPTITNKFIWLGLSERRPLTRASSNLAADEAAFFEALDFLPN